MATYPIKMLKDENGTPFVPLISLDSVQDADGKNINDLLENKIEATDIKAGNQIEIEVDGNTITINNSAEGMKLINNTDTTVAGTGALDAVQGKVLKDSIPEVVNNLTTIDSKKALSAHQGYILAGRVAPVGGATGQVLKKASDSDYSFEWGDAADPNAIVGDGSIMKIIELTYNEYLELEKNNALAEDTEYHISDWNENERTYLTTQDIEEIVYDKTANHTTENQVASMIEGSIVNNLTSTSTTKSLSAAQGQKLQAEINQLKDWQYTPSQLIAEVTATGFVPVLKIDNLDLGPGTYEIVYAEYSSAASGPGHVLRLNGATSGYQGIHMHPAGLSASDEEGKWRIAYHGNGLAYVNGWSHGTQLCFGTYTLHYFNKDWITATGQSHLTPSPHDVPSGGVDGEWNILFEQGSYNGHVTEKITSISIEPLDSTTIGTGSYIRLYKK